MRVGRVAALWRYPVKSLLGERLESARIGPQGLAGDRGWALAEGPGRWASAKRFPALMLASARFLEEPSPGRIPHASVTLPDGSRVLTSDEESASRLSSWLGRPVALDRAAGRHFDAKPLHLLTTASLASLSRLNPSSSFDPRRFRPNILIDDAEGEAFPELAWTRRRVRVGRAVLTVREPTSRCVMTTLPQGDLPKDPGVLRAIARKAGNDLGVYAEAATSGEVRVGDAVELL